MKRVQIISFTEKKNDQEAEEVNMTPEQRLLLAFQLMDLAITISPSKELTSYDEGTIKWLDLQFRK